MRHDTWVEQRGRFERILIQEVGPRQLALLLRECDMCIEGLFHFVSARLEQL